MLLASSYVLNRCPAIGHHRIYPWVHALSNRICAEDMLLSVDVPDVAPAAVDGDGDAVPRGPMSMSAGEFTEIYTDAAAWDVIVTCFFIDTAKNVLAYIDTIWNSLRPGGVWINLGAGDSAATVCHPAVAVAH